MNNLSHNAEAAKQAYLENQRAQVVESYRNAPKSERAAVVRHIGGFLPTCNKNERIFWLKVWRALERISETTLPI